MDVAELQVQARRTRETYARETARRYGRSWTPEEYMLGFLGDVGDLAKLVQGTAGVRPRADLDDALAHENLLTLDHRDADRLGHIRPGGGEAELGYMFVPEAWGQGFATEACSAALDWFAQVHPDEPVVSSPPR